MSGTNRSCGVEKKCGACQLTNMDYERQLRFKQAKIVKLIGRCCRVGEIIGMDEPYGYRNKAQYAVRRVRGRVVTGVYQSATGGIAVTDTCYLNDARSNMIASTAARIVTQLHIEPYSEKGGKGVLRHILVRRANATGEYMVVLVCFADDLKHESDLTRRLTEAFPEIKTIVLNISRSAKMTLGREQRVLFGSGYIEDVLLGKRFRISPRSFYQINPEQTERLYKTAIEFAGLRGGERIFDAYCGIGTIGICASDGAGSIIGVEQNGEAVRDARENAKINGIDNAEYIESDAAEYLRSAAENGEHIDVVFTDPPRAGCSMTFLKSLVKLSPETVVYVSCDPQTLARDLFFLTKNGYKVRRIQPVDMFPFTQHVECVVLLQKFQKKGD